MKMFDYIFYRVAKFFYQKDGIDAFKAICTVSLIQILLLGNITYLFLRIIFGISETSKHQNIGTLIGLIFGIVLLVYNYFRYKNRYWILAKNWNNSETPTKRKIRGFLVLLAILIPIIALFWMGTSG